MLIGLVLALGMAMNSGNYAMPKNSDEAKGINYLYSNYNDVEYRGRFDENGFDTLYFKADGRVYRIVAGLVQIKDKDKKTPTWTKESYHFETIYIPAFDK